MNLRATVLDVIAFFDTNPIRRAARACRRALDRLDAAGSTAAALRAAARRVEQAADDPAYVEVMCHRSVSVALRAFAHDLREAAKDAERGEVRHA